MEVETVAGESGDGFGEFGGVRVLVGRRGGRARGLWRRLLVAKGGERGFNSEATLTFATLGGCFLRRSEGEETEGEK